MAVIINEFEAVAETPAPPPRVGAAAEPGHDPRPTVLEAKEVAPALHDIDTRALRAWAH